MKGEIVDGTNSSALDLESITEKIWKDFDNEFAIEILWEALDLIGLYIILRTMYHILLAVEYISLEVRTSPVYLIEQKLVQNERSLVEEGKSRLWQLNKYHISGTCIKVRSHLTMKSKIADRSYRHFFIESVSKSTHCMIPNITKTINYLYCC
jgi:hypothetical protein